jgi:DNA sulfur modification protein DndC
VTSPFAPHALDPALDAAIGAIRADLRDEYLQPHGFPWIVGFSGGKDSTLVAHLVFDLLLSLAPDDRRSCPLAWCKSAEPRRGSKLIRRPRRAA